MYNNNGRPLNRRQTIRIFVAVLILAWATQTLFHQWSFGQEIPAARFVADPNAPAAVVELRGDATIVGADVQLKQIARWADKDATALSPIADLIVLHMNPGVPYRTITLGELRGLLSDAGVNLATIRLGGATRCTIARSDVTFNQGDALQKWLDARTPSTQPTAAGSPIDPPATVSVTTGAPQTEAVKTLRSLISQDLAVRLQLSPDQLSVTFNPKDDRVLGLVEGVFKFSLEPGRARDLGLVIYDVTISNNGNSQRLTINATARAWQEQVVVARPIDFHSVIQPADLQERRLLVDHLPDDPLLTTKQIVGQQAARELKAGMVMTARMVEAVPLVRPGQLVTISYQQGNLQLRSVGRSMDTGCYGQSVRVKNDVTGATLDVTLTGPQTGTVGTLPSVAQAVSSAR